MLGPCVELKPSLWRVFPPPGYGCAHSYVTFVVCTFLCCICRLKYPVVEWSEEFVHLWGHIEMWTGCYIYLRSCVCMRVRGGWGVFVWGYLAMGMLRVWHIVCAADGMLEVVGTEGLVHMLSVRLRLRHSIRLAQGRKIKITVRKQGTLLAQSRSAERSVEHEATAMFAAQIDGESWEPEVGIFC